MAPEFGKSIHQLPLIPAEVLKKHRVHEPLDTRFRSAARLLQEDWGLPIGSVGEDGKRRKLGSRISQAAGRLGGNFLTPEIAHIARRETAYREIALIDTERLATNLLSSMPLTFNLLAPWQQALERAQGYLIELLPGFTGKRGQRRLNGIKQRWYTACALRPKDRCIATTVDDQGRIVQLTSGHELAFGEVRGASSTRIHASLRLLALSGHILL